MSVFKELEEFQNFLKYKFKGQSKELYITEPVKDPMDKGFYTLTQDDKNLSEFFDDREYTLLMKRIYRQIGFSRGFTEEARKACGYPKDKLHRDEISNSRVFVVTDNALHGIVVKENKGILGKIPVYIIIRLKLLVYLLII